jgi:hypothetical protein
MGDWLLHGSTTWVHWIDNLFLVDFDSFVFLVPWPGCGGWWAPFLCILAHSKIAEARRAIGVVKDTMAN